MSMKPDPVTVAKIEHLTCACGGHYVRCGRCGHPANIARPHGTALVSVSHRCPVCGTSWDHATPCTRSEFLASRADYAPHPSAVDNASICARSGA